MAKKERYSDVFYRPSIGAIGESEGSDSSGHADHDLSMPLRKCISLNTDNFSIPTQVLPLSKMSSMEKKNLVLRLRAELERIHLFQKKLNSYRIRGGSLSSSSDILNCGASQNGPPLLTSRTEKVVPGDQKGRGWNRGSSGKFQSSKQTSVPATSMPIIIKQCETLLGRLMSHQYAWVFKEPVDVVKLNIPDYLTVIKHPMDLGTVKRKLSSGVYLTAHDFVADVRLTFSNAMTYNPPGNDVHVMARTLSQFFEVRWKTIEKKLPPTETEKLPAKSYPRQEVKPPELTAPSKKRKMSSMQPLVMKEHVQKMTSEEKNRLSRELESFMGDLPDSVIEFLKEHCSSGSDTAEDEIEIDLDVLSDETLYRLRKLLDDCMQERQKNDNKMGEPCEIELLHGSGLSNSSIQAGKGGEPIDEDVDIEDSEPPVTSYCSAEVNKDKSSSKFLDPNGSPRTSESMIGLNEVEQIPQRTSRSLGSDGPHNGENASNEEQIPSEKLYRAALLKSRFADTILKAQEKTLSQVDKGDPEKLRFEREKLEMLQRKEKARLQAEAKVAEEARRQAEAEAAAEAKRKREMERAAARQALLEMEKTVEINENARILKELEMFGAAPVEQVPNSGAETSPVHSQEGLHGLKFGAGGSNPLEQLGLYRKDDEEEDEAEPTTMINQANDVEEGEID